MDIHRPIPRRHFEISPSSPDSESPSLPPSPGPEQASPGLSLDSKVESGLSPSRTRSVLNLTSSTLFGIYAGTGQDGSTPQELSTPWGTGAQTPIHGRSPATYLPQEADVRWRRGSVKPETTSHLKRSGVRGHYGRVAVQTLLLFAFGLGYGYLVNQLHRTGSITAVPVPVQEGGKGSSYYYLLLWGLLGVILGNGLPLLDAYWTRGVEVEDERRAKRQARGSLTASNDTDSNSDSDSDSAVSPLWYSVVRSIGAFVGIAFAVRRVPWTSTLQVSLTLALANPVLWYLIDRSVTGFALSGFVGLVGTLVLLLVNPGFVPVSAIHQDTASEQLGVYIWLASILFCTSLCFGAVGRKLQILH